MHDDEEFAARRTRTGSVRPGLYRIVSAGATALVAIATVVYRFAEDWSWVDAFYFSIVAATTVGFGDLAPTTTFAKLFTVAYIVAGVSLVGAVIDERLRRHHQALAWFARHASGPSHDDPGDSSGDR